MTPPKRPSILVAGAGISGLSAAYTLLRERPDIDLCVVESRRASGRQYLDGSGARVSSLMLALIHSCARRPKPQICVVSSGSDDDLISPSTEGRRVLIAHKGQLVPMPAGMALGCSDAHWTDGRFTAVELRW